MTNSNRPIKTVRAGNVRAAIWANVAEDDRTYYSVTVTRSYRDGEEWKDSTVFGKDELPRVELVTRKAYEYISLNAEKARNGESFVERVGGEESDRECA